MFSSIARSIKSIAKGPRAVLAENIARALSEHFVLDPADIESSLLQDARIVLKNTQLRSRRYRSESIPDTVVSVNGIVDEVVFSWRWSFSAGGSSTSTTITSNKSSTTGSSSGGSGVVQDVVLAIRGVKAQIVLDRWDNLDKEEQALVENLELTLTNGDEKEKQDESSDGTSLQEKEGFVQKYIKQIVDNLTLKFHDFEFTLKAQNGPSVIIAGKDLELETLSSAMERDKRNHGSSTTLSQRISIGSFFVNTIDGKSGNSSPLIEPFGYVASIVRHSGERFKGGILSGLQVIGLPEEQHKGVNAGETSTDEGILFHIGIPQIKALSTLGALLVPSNAYSASTTPARSEKNDAGMEQGKGSSVFNLSLPALTIVLPPSGVENVPTKLTLPKATVLYRADGQVFRIEGKEGIKDNGKSLVEFSSSGKWLVDFANRIFDLDKDGAGCKISLSDETLMRISSSLTSLSSTHEVSNLKGAWDDEAGSAASRETWSIFTGNITVQLTGVDNHWIETSVAHSHLQLCPAMKTLIEAKIGYCTVKSSLDQAAAITVPSFSLISGMLSVSDEIDAVVSSVDDALRVKSFLLSFLGPFEGRNDTFDMFPFPVEIPSIKLSSFNPPSTIHIGTTSANGSYIKCEQLDTKMPNSISFSMKELLGDIKSQSLSIDCIESLSLPGTLVLSKPLINTKLKFEKEILYINIPTTIHGEILLKSTSPKKSPTQQSEMNVPFRVSVNVSKANLKTLREADKKCVQMEGIVVDLSPVTLPSLDLSSKRTQKGAKISLKIENIDHEMFQARKLKTSTILPDQNLETFHQLDLSLYSARVEAGYSATEWTSLFTRAESSDGTKQKVLKMPFAKVARTSLSISYQGSVVDGNSTVSIPDFKGHSLTTSTDISNHYFDAVIQRIPGLLTNVNILGTNVVDGTFAAMGKMALGAKNVTTAGMGSVVGTVASDGLKAAIASGKSARNVSNDDSYQFGDVTRGIFNGIRHASKKGAQSRGSDGSDYIPGDFTVGTAKALGNYGEKNSRKLASAGASGAAATIGLAIAGPVGLLAGAYMGGKMVGDGKGERQQQVQQGEQRLQLKQPPERAFDPLRQNQKQQFVCTPQQEQQGMPMVYARQQQTVDIPMVNAQIISHEQVYAEPVTNTVSNDRLRGNNSSRHQNMYQQPHSEETRRQSYSSQRHQSHQFQFTQPLQNQQYQHYESQSNPHPQQQQEKAYKFGDFTRGIVAKGKKADGRSQDSGYKFGDFTRGLFK